VLATGPFVGCAGADPAGSEPGGFSGNEGKAGGSAGSGNPAAGGGSNAGSSPVASAGTSTGSNPFANGGNGSGGNPFASSGNGTGGSPVVGTAGKGSSGAATAGAPSNVGSGTPIGNVSAYPVGSLLVGAGIFLIGRDAKGMYAMSMQCTHKGCALVFVGSQLDCPCHHSRFDANGNVLVGPATTPLPHFAVSVDAAGNLSVDQYTVVSASARTAV